MTLPVAAADGTRDASIASMRRLLRWFLAVLVVVAVLCVVASNVLLMTSLGPALASSARTETTWRRGWALLPWRVHLRDLRVRTHGKASLLEVDADRAFADVSIAGLFGHRLDTSSVELDGVRFSLTDVAPESQPPPATAKATTTAPPIALVRATDEPPADREWSFRAEDATATDVRELVVGYVVYRGGATLHGAVEVPRSGPARVAHGAADLGGGALTIGRRLVVEHVRGHVALDAQSLDTDEPSRAAWARTVDGGAELTGDVVHGDARGTFRASVRIARGALAPRSAVEVHVPEAAASADRFASADAVLGVDEHGATRASALVHGIAWPADDRSEIARADEVRVEVTSPRVALVDPLRDAAGSVHARGVAVEAARIPWGSSLFFADHARLGGAADLTIAGGTVSGRAHLSGADVTLRLGDVRLPGSLDVTASLRDWRPDAPVARFDLHLVQKNGDEGAQPPLTLDLDDARLRLGKDHVLDATAHLRMADARAALDALTGEGRLPPLVSAAAATQPLDATALVHADADAIALRDVRASAGVIGIRGELLDAHDAPVEATMLFELGPLATGVRREHGETTLVLADARRWFDDTVAASPP